MRTTENNKKFWRRYCQIWIYFLTGFIFLKASTSYCYQVKCYLACFSCLHSVCWDFKQMHSPVYSIYLGSLCCSWPRQGESVWWAFFHSMTKLQPGSTAQCTFLHSVIPPPDWFKPRLVTEINSAKFSSTSTFIYTWTETQTVAPVPSEGDQGCAEILEENYIWYEIDNLHLHSAWVILTDGINSLHGKYKWKWLQALQLQ